MKIFFGGTFNPIHLGHLWIADHVSCFFKQPVCFIPAGMPCHKTNVLAAKHRLQMVKLALKESQHWVSTIEIYRSGPSYTVDTIKSLCEQYPNETIVWLMGTDSWESFSTWDGFKTIQQLAHIIVVNRHPIPEHALTAYPEACQAGTHQFLNIPHHPANSTQIRTCPNDFSAWIPKLVREYIESNQLFPLNGDTDFCAHSEMPAPLSKSSMAGYST